MTKKKSPTPPTRSYSVRCAPDLWAATRERARKDGVTTNHVITEFLQMYAEGSLDLPKYVRIPSVPTK